MALKPPLVAHTLHLLRTISWVRDEEVGEPRELVHCTPARGSGQEPAGQRDQLIPAFDLTYRNVRFEAREARARVSTNVPPRPAPPLDGHAGWQQSAAVRYQADTQ